MELDQAATSSLVRALQQGVERLDLDGGVRLHIQTLLEWDGKGRCSHIRCYDDTDTWDTYMEEMKTWADRVNWDVSKGDISIEMKRKIISNMGIKCVLM